MKKYIITVIILLGFQFAKSQSLYQRYLTANKDTIRTQLRMAFLDYAEAQADTATKKNERLCKNGIAALGGGWYTDVLSFMYAVKENNAVPTDGQIRNFVVIVWARLAELESRR
jgi:hypothetical protein